jgi:signal transduction histidine kinase
MMCIGFLAWGSSGRQYRLHRLKADEKKMDIKHICEAQLTSWFDSSLLEQAVVNLLDNAIKYSEPNSTIHLKANLKDSEVKIIVEDRGIGIAQIHLPRLFERFYRVDKARSLNLGGTGLGLAIVKHIAQAHGGKVTVESTLGEGCVFTITSITASPPWHRRQSKSTKNISTLPGVRNRMRFQELWRLRKFP